MRIAREVPLNPNVVLYHVDRPLTTAVVEAYYAASEDVPSPYDRLLAEGAETVHVTRYRVAVRKPRDWDMLAFLQTIEPSLSAFCGIPAIPAAPSESAKRRTFDTAFDPTRVGSLEVYEGSGAARRNAIAAAFFGIDGVAKAILAPSRITICKGTLFDWETLELAIRDVLETFEQESPTIRAIR